jgi:hypothetical protein
MAQTLSQTQIIRSLSQALEWFEKEVQWGVSPGELNHLTGRIGELYAAMITRGQMALATNQRGYDVVSLAKQRISVKTVTTSTQATFNASTFGEVDRVIILRIVIDDDDVSIEEILDCPAADIAQRGANKNGRIVIPIPRAAVGANASAGGLVQPATEQTGARALKEIGTAIHGRRRVVLYENGMITVETDGDEEDVAKPVLREIAREIGVDFLNGAGNPKNTRTLGTDIIKALS